MATVAEAFSLALRHHQAGRLQEAEALYRQILQTQPNHPDVCNNLGVVLKQQGKLEEAVTQYRQALALTPTSVPACTNLGNALREQGKLEEAIGYCRQALTLNPNYAEAHNNLGLALQEQGHVEEAVAAYRQALALTPTSVPACTNLGNALREQGKLEEAIGYCRQALTLNPNYAEAHNNLGLALQEQGYVEEAVASFRLAVTVRPDYAQAHSNLGIALTNTCQFQEAEASCRRALEIKPDFSEAYNNLANVLKDQGKIHEAVSCYRRALTIKPDNVTAHSNLVMVMSYDADYAPKTIAAEHRQWNALHAHGLTPRAPVYSNSCDEERKLRVGYVSGDFRGHPIGYWLESLLTNHRRSEFEIVGYSAGTGLDETTCRLQGATDAWRSTVGMSDDALAALVRSDRIDILVDLSGHTECNRLLVFARKPAPVQVTYLGSLTTTGLSTMDYKLTDRFLTPLDSKEEFTEELIRLPGCFACYKAPPGSPNVTPLPVSKTGRATFSSFNNPAKVTPQVVAVWSKILHAVPESRLILKYRTFRDPGVQARYRELFEGYGIEAKRLELLPATPFPGHLALYAQVDIALDPFPYNGCYTSSEALWMGVPVITLAGNMSYSRYGVTLLANLGLPQFIAATPEEYVKIAVSLAEDPRTLAALRAELRSRMVASPLCDPQGYAQGVEEAYRHMWRRWCQDPT